MIRKLKSTCRIYSIFSCGRKGRKIKIIIYVLRTIPLIALFLLVLFFQTKNMLSQTGQRGLATALGYLDIWRGIFYGLTPSFLILLFFPINKIGSTGFKWRLSIGGLAGLICCGSVIIGYACSRKDLLAPNEIIVASIWLGLNILLFLASKPHRKKSLFSRFLTRGFFLSDILFPAALWREYFKNSKISGRMAVLFALVMLSIPFFAISPKIMGPLKIGPYVDVSIIRLTPPFANPYGLTYSHENKVLWTSDRERISRLKIEGGKITHRVDSSKFPGPVDIFAQSDDGRELTVASFNEKNSKCHLVKLDSTTLTPIKKWVFGIAKAGNVGGAIMLLDSEREIAIGAFEGALMRFSTDFNQITAFSYLPYLSDAILDPAKRIVYACFYDPGIFLSFDADSLEVKDFILLPQFAQRMTLDKKRRRLFVSFPVEGIIRVVDIERFIVEKEILTLPGVREMAVIEDKDVIITGGFSPYMEVFSLNNLALVKRIKGPPWQREIIISKRDNLAYISTFGDIWKMDTGNVAVKSLHHIFDPYFLILKGAIGPVQRWTGFRPLTGKESDVKICRPAKSIDAKDFDKKENPGKRNK